MYELKHITILIVIINTRTGKITFLTARVKVRAGRHTDLALTRICEIRTGLQNVNPTSPRIMNGSPGITYS